MKRFPQRSASRNAAAALVALVLAVALVVPAALGQSRRAEPAKVFPYPIHKKTLENGLDVIVIEMPEFAGVLSYNTLVLAGARNETEKGRTGLAHLFEHILFRHRFRGQEDGYDNLMSRMGTHNNAWTWFDVTYYHPLTFTDNLVQPRAGELPGLVELEAARFTALDFTEQIFRTEAGAVLGEYRRNASFPSLRMSERLMEMKFPHHPYGHTTIGFYDDVVDMPNQYEAAVRFYDTYYRPNNCVLVIAGDVKADEVIRIVEPHYRDWQPKEIPKIEPTGEPPRGPLRHHLVWDSDVAPLVWVSHRMPAHRTGSVDTAVAQLLPELLVSETAPLYRRLRFEKQSAAGLGFAEGSRGYESFDPRAVIVQAQLFKEQHAARGAAYFDEVAADIVAGMEELGNFSRQRDARERLARMKSKYRYDFLAGMSSPANVAQAFSWHYRFERDPEVFEKLLASVERLTPRDIDAFARRWFTPENRAVLTLAAAAARAEE
jgi:zinc protease